MDDVNNEGWSLTRIFKWAAGLGVLAGGVDLLAGAGLSDAAGVGFVSALVGTSALSWLDMGVRGVKKLLNKFKGRTEDEPVNAPLQALENKAEIENTPVNDLEQDDRSVDLSKEKMAAIRDAVFRWGAEDSAIPAIEIALLRKKFAEQGLDIESDDVWQEIARSAAPDWKKAVEEGRHEEVWPDVLAADVTASHLSLARSFARSAAEYQPPEPGHIEFDSGTYYSNLAKFELEKAGLNPDTAVARFVAGLPQPGMQ